MKILKYFRWGCAILLFLFGIDDLLHFKFLTGSIEISLSLLIAATELMSKK